MVKPGMMVTLAASIAVAAITFFVNYENMTKASVLAIAVFSITFLAFTIIFRNKVSEIKEEDVYVYAEIMATKLRSQYNLMISIEKNSFGVITKFPKTHALVTTDDGNVIWCFVDDSGKDRNFVYNIHKKVITKAVDYSQGVSPSEKVRGMIDLINLQKGENVVSTLQGKDIKQENQQQGQTTKDILQQLMGNDKEEGEEKNGNV